MTGENNKLPDGNNPIVDYEIDGIAYVITRLGWHHARKGIGLLNEVAGKPISAALGVDSIDVDEDVVALIMRALPDALARAAGPEGDKLEELWGAQTVVTATDADGLNPRDVRLVRAVRDTWFSQHPDHVVPWVEMCFRVQVADFFGPVRARLATLMSSARHGPAQGAADKGPASPTI